MKLEGVRSVERDDLLGGLVSQQSCSWSWTRLCAKRVYSAAALAADVQRIEGYYAWHGFLWARVVDRQVERVKGGRAVDIVLRVDEGQPVTVRSVDLRGGDQLDQKTRGRVQRAVHVVTGQRYQHTRYASSQAAIKATLRDGGYPYAEVRGRVDVDAGRTDARVIFEIDPGPRVSFGPTEVVGAAALPRNKLLRMRAWRDGDRYRPTLLDDTRRRLVGLRVFSSVRLDLPEQPTARPPVRMRLKLAPLRELRIGGGIGVESLRQEVRQSTRLTWHNFLGGLRTFSIQLRPAYVFIPTVWQLDRGGPAVEARMDLVQPDAFETGIGLAGMLSYELSVFEAYRVHGPRTRLGADRGFLGDRLHLGLSWNLEYSDFFDISLDPQTLPLRLRFDDPYRLAYLEETLRIDLRDSSIDPRSGFLAEMAFEQGRPEVGGQYAYLRITPELRGYVPLGTKRVVLAMRAMLGRLYPHGDGDSPVTRRYYLGGPTDHRGFSYRRLTIQARTAAGEIVPLGANAAALFSVDLRLRVFRLWGEWLSFEPSFDAGDVAAALSDLRWRQLQLAVGGAVVYNTPIGPLRVGLGVRLNRLNDQPSSLPGAEGTQLLGNPDPGQRLAFHLALGQAF